MRQKRAPIAGPSRIWKDTEILKRVVMAKNHPGKFRLPIPEPICGQFDQIRPNSTKFDQKNLNPNSLMKWPEFLAYPELILPFSTLNYQPSTHPTHPE